MYTTILREILHKLSTLFVRIPIWIIFRAFIRRWWLLIFLYGRNLNWRLLFAWFQFYFAHSWLRWLLKAVPRWNLLLFLYTFCLFHVCITDTHLLQLLIYSLNDISILLFVLLAWFYCWKFRLHRYRLEFLRLHNLIVFLRHSQSPRLLTDITANIYIEVFLIQIQDQIFIFLHFY